MNSNKMCNGIDEPISESSEVCRLAILAAGGDDMAFDSLFSLYREHLKQYVDLRLDVRVKSRFDSSDVIQETQIEAHRRISDFVERRPMPIRVWLRNMARERLLDLYKRHLTRQKRSVNREVAMPDRSSIMLANKLVDGGLSPSKELIKGENQRSVAIAIQRLNDLDREIILMRFIEGLGYREISYSLDISESAVTKRCGRALRKLYEHISESGLEEDRFRE